MYQSILNLLKNLTQGNYQQLAADFEPEYFKLISKSGGILSAESLRSIHAALEEGKVEDVVDEIQQSLNAAENASLNVAVIGDSGSGKSSFINALRGLSHQEEGSASVGVVETTMRKTPYQHPKYPKVTFWDLPGNGSPNFHPDTYLETMGLAEYDFFIIISSSRFSFNDADLAQKINKMGKKFYFVRTKVDSDLYNEKRAKPKSFQREKVLQQIRDDCVTHLQNNGVPEPQVFLVSNFDLGDFDLLKLEETLLKELPAHKRHVLALLMPSSSEDAIEMKKTFLREKIWLEALKSAAVGLVPCMPFISGFGVAEQQACLKVYRSHFGVDNESIEKISQKLGVSVDHLKNLIKSSDFWHLVKDDSIEAQAMTYAELLCSVTGGPVSAVIQFFKVYFLHIKFLDTVADDAKRLFQMMKQ
jgi:predicted GTPase